MDNYVTELGRLFVMSLAHCDVTKKLYGLATILS